MLAFARRQIAAARGAAAGAVGLTLIAASGPAAGAATSVAASASSRAGAATPAASRLFCARPRSAPPSRGTLPAAVIRVDQVGYPAASPKLAEIMTATSHPGPLRWLLIRQGGCSVAASGTASINLGPWSTHYPAVWLASFSRVHATGTYRLVLAKAPAIASPWFTIAPAARLYARPLANAVAFYAAERDGPNFIRSALRTAPGHLNDARAMTYRTPPMNGNGNFTGSLAPYATGRVINATGGWWDAGDYLKFAETTSYTVLAMLQGVVSFPHVLGAHAKASVRGEAKFGLDFLQRLWNERTRTLYYQVGIGGGNSQFLSDHDIWRLPQADDHYGGTKRRYLYIRHRPVFRAGPPGSRISPNLAGRLAAAFGLCYRVFRASDRTYADRCLRSAETVYALAGTPWRGRLLTVAPFSFYPETSWRDDMMLGATELSLALRAARGSPLPRGLPVRSAATYLRDAATWAREWVNSPQSVSDTLNLYDVSGLAYYELSRAIGLEHPGRLPITRARLLTAMRAQLLMALKVARSDPFRFGFAWDQFDTTAHGAGLTVMANEYDALARRPVLAGWAQRWLDDILGANAWGVSLIVGDGTVFPRCMQHQVANLAGSHNGKPPVLAGATVEGPNSFAATGTVPNMRPCSARAPGGFAYSVFNGHRAVFADNVQSWSTVEPAIDLTALTPLAFAWQQTTPGSLPPP